MGSLMFMMSSPETRRVLIKELSNILQVEVDLFLRAVHVLLSAVLLGQLVLQADDALVQFRSALLFFLDLEIEFTFQFLDTRQNGVHSRRCDWRRLRRSKILVCLVDEKGVS